MAVRVVRLGSPRAPAEGLRIGTVRRPPRGVPKADFAKRDFYDVWLPLVAPSEALLKAGLAAQDDAARWKAFARRYRAEMKRPDAQLVLDLLAALSHRDELLGRLLLRRREPLPPVAPPRAARGSRSRPRPCRVSLSCLSSPVSARSSDPASFFFCSCFCSFFEASFPRGRSDVLLLLRLGLRLLSSARAARAGASCAIGSGAGSTTRRGGRLKGEPGPARARLRARAGGQPGAACGGGGAGLPADGASRLRRLAHRGSRRTGGARGAARRVRRCRAPLGRRGIGRPVPAASRGPASARGPGPGAARPRHPCGVRAAPCGPAARRAGSRRPARRPRATWRRARSTAWGLTGAPRPSRMASTLRVNVGGAGGGARRAETGRAITASGGRGAAAAVGAERLASRKDGQRPAHDGRALQLAHDARRRVPRRSGRVAELTKADRSTTVAYARFV